MSKFLTKIHDRIDPFMRGPKYWPKWVRRIYAVFLPISFPLFLVAWFTVIILFICAVSVVDFIEFIDELWNSEQRKIRK